jgi:hypothetical protein
MSAPNRTKLVSPQSCGLEALKRGELFVGRSRAEAGDQSDGGGRNE